MIQEERGWRDDGERGVVRGYCGRGLPQNRPAVRRVVCCTAYTRQPLERVQRAHHETWSEMPPVISVLHVHVEIKHFSKRVLPMKFNSQAYKICHQSFRTSYTLFIVKEWDMKEGRLLLLELHVLWTYMFSTSGVLSGVSGGGGWCLSHGWLRTSLADSLCFTSVWSRFLKRSFASSDTLVHSWREGGMEREKERESERENKVEVLSGRRRERDWLTFSVMSYSPFLILDNNISWRIQNMCIAQ